MTGLHDVLKRIGVQQKALAARAGLSRPFVSLVCTGKRSVTPEIWRAARCVSLEQAAVAAADAGAMKLAEELLDVAALFDERDGDDCDD